MNSIDSLIAEARLLIEEKKPDLEQLTEELRDLLTEKSYRVGTVRKWGGIEYQKMQDKQWAKVAKGRVAKGAPTAGISSVPPQKLKQTIGHLKKTLAQLQKHAPAAVSKEPEKGKKEPEKAPAATAAPAGAAPAPGKAPRATADSLPDDPYKYFKKTPDAQLIPVAALKTIRARPEGIANAAKHMANAFNGDGDKRKPISLKDNGDGTYTVMDGNSTTAMAKQHNWKNIVAVVEPPGGEPASDHGDHAGAAPAEVEKAAVEVPGLADLVAKGKLAPGVTVAEHVKIAKDFLDAHKKSLDRSVATLKGHMPEGMKIKGRVKELDSALGKLVRKPKYQTVDKLQDGTGMRGIAGDSGTLDKAIASLKKNYKVVSEDDYITTPNGGATGLGYRSYHAIVEDEDGLQKEIQLRTANQNIHAEWCHDVYKPQTPEQDKAMKENADTIAQYARDMGDFFAKVDKAEKPGEAPPCPPPVKQYFSCL